MRIPKKGTIIIITIITLLIIGGIVWNKIQQKKAAKVAEQKMMYEVNRGDLQVEVKVTATANLVNEQNLSFGQAGKITKVNIAVGDEVQADDILAELDMDEYYNTIQTAELEVANAQLGLEKLLHNDTSLREAQLHSQINEAKASYAIEQEQYEVLQQQLTTLIQQKTDQLDQQSRSYGLNKKELEFAGEGLVVDINTDAPTENALQVRKQTINTIISTLVTSLGDAEFAVESIDQIFGVSDTYVNDAEIYVRKLAAKDTQLRSQTTMKIRQSYALLETFKEKIDALDTTSSDNEIYSVVQDFYSASALFNDLCDTALDALDMTNAGATLSANTLAGFIATTTTARSTTTALRGQLQTLANSVSSLLLSYDTQRASLQTQEESITFLNEEIKTLQKDHENQRMRKQAQIETLRERIDVLEQELDDLLDGPDTYDIQQQRNSIRQAQLRLARAEDQQDDYQIIAEFDGRVRTVDIVEGEQYELDDRKFIVVENPNLIELELQVSQIDIVKIKEGDPVIITFDAYPNNPIKANITSRNVNPKANGRGGFWYETTILLEKQEREILAGMSALVTIVTDQVQDAVLIPTLSIVHKNKKTFVYQQQGKDRDLHEVELGIMNNFQAQVLRGLDAGTIINSSVLDEDVLKEMGIDDSSNSPFGKSE